ncbi:hypothetical protein AGMMS49592_5820 [Endomicrobiia bacterium]|nr:hypothetical protein AGMMS49592_5820 [Endomicrobiia bacterium]
MKLTEKNMSATKLTILQVQKDKLKFTKRKNNLTRKKQQELKKQRKQINVKSK